MTIERKTYNVKDIAQILGISVPAAYSLAAQNSFPSIRIGERRIIIPCDAFNKWVDEQAAAPKQ